MCLEGGEQTRFLFGVDEVDPVLFLVSSELLYELEPRVDRFEDRMVRLGDLPPQSLDDRIAHGRPGQWRKSGFGVRGIVINRNGYVTPARTG